MNKSVLAITIIVACAPTLTAQTEVDLKWQKSHVVVKFNPVRFGKHSLAELPIGGKWRMGMNTASTIATDVPLVGDRGIVAPGSYRVSLGRKSKSEFGLQVASTQLATEGKQAYFSTTLEDAKITAKLELQWLKGSKGKKTAPAEKPGADEKGTKAAPVDPIDGKHAQRATLRLAFGPYRLDMPIAMVAAKPAKVRGFKANSFEWPDALFQTQLQKGHAIPILTLRAKGGSKSRPKVFNLLINDEKAEFYPAMVAPTGSFGFAGVKGFDADDILRGTIEWSDSQRDARFLTVSGLAIKKRQLELTVAVGKREELPLQDLPVRRLYIDRLTPGLGR